MTVEEALQIAQRHGCDRFALELTDPAGFLFGNGKPGGDGVFVYAESGEWRPISSDHLFKVRLIIKNERELPSALNNADVHSVGDAEWIRYHEWLHRLTRLHRESVRRLLKMSDLELAQLLQLFVKPTVGQRLFRSVKRLLLGVRRDDK